MRHALKSFIRVQGQIEMAICMLLVGLIIGTIIYQVVARYVFNAPLAWMEEVVTIFFILLTLFGACVAAKDKRHILVDLFPRGPVARFLGVVMSLGTIAILVVLLTYAAPVLKVQFIRQTISLPVNFRIAYYNILPLIYCFGSIILSTAYDVIYERKDENEALV